MNVIELARQLGAELQKDGRYAAFYAAKELNDKDDVLQGLIEKFNDLRKDLNVEMSKDDKDTETMKRLDEEIRKIYAEIMSRPAMIEYNNTKDALDMLLNSINYIITMAANGEDPMTCPEEQPHSCSGSCSTCGGCH